MQRVVLEKKKRKPTNGFKPGNQLAVGNRGPEIRKQKRFIAVTLRNELLRKSGRKDGSLNVHHVCENMVRIAKQQYDDSAAIQAAKYVTETVEPKQEKVGVVLDQRTANITLNMTEAEAEKLYRNTLIEQLPDE